MSSDESDHEAGRGEATYFIRTKPWRSPKVTVWLRTFDALHLRERYNGGFRASAGAWPHFRMVSKQMSQRPALKGLPKNCYDAGWLRSRSAFQLLDLNTAEEFNLKLDSDIMKYVDLLLMRCLELMPVSMRCREARKYDLSNRQVVCGLGNESTSD